MSRVVCLISRQYRHWWVGYIPQRTVTQHVRRHNLTDII